MLKKYAPNFQSLRDSASTLFKARPMPRTAENLKNHYADSTEMLVEGGNDLVLANARVRYIAFRDYSLNTTGNGRGEPPVLNINVDPEFNPHVLSVVGGRLQSAPVGSSGKVGTLEIAEFFEYIRLGVFVFVDFEK